LLSRSFQACFVSTTPCFVLSWEAHGAALDKKSSVFMASLLAAIGGFLQKRTGPLATACRFQYL